MRLFGKVYYHPGPWYNRIIRYGLRLNNNEIKHNKHDTTRGNSRSNTGAIEAHINDVFPLFLRPIANCSLTDRLSSWLDDTVIWFRCRGENILITLDISARSSGVLFLLIENDFAFIGLGWSIHERTHDSNDIACFKLFEVKGRNRNDRFSLQHCSMIHDSLASNGKVEAIFSIKPTCTH